jgi:hypothetical protein
MLAGTILLPALSGVARAGGTDDFGCSGERLKIDNKTVVDCCAVAMLSSCTIVN